MSHRESERPEMMPVSDLVRRKIGKHLSPQTIWRWICGRGVSGVNLEAQSVGGTWYTTDAAWDRFVQQQTAARHRRSQSNLESSDEDADLKAAGIL